MTRRTLFKAIAAAVAAPMAFLWPKTTEGRIRYSRAYADPHHVKMTTWWERENGELEWRFFAISAPPGENFWKVRRIFGSQVTHYCEWGEVLNNHDLKWLNAGGSVASCGKHPLCYIPGATIA